MLAPLATFIGYALTLIALGLIVGFSPTLYITQVGILTRGRRPLRQSALLMAGVASAAVLLALFSDVIQPAVLLSYTHNALLIVTAEQWFDYVLGAAFVLIGFYHIVTPPRAKPRTKKPTGSAATSLYVFGLIKTLFSVSGFAALLLGTRLITELAGRLTVQLMLFSVLLAAVVLPFAGLLLLHTHRPQTFHRLNNLLERAATYNYRTLAGAALCVIGASLIMLQFIVWN